MISSSSKSATSLTPRSSQTSKRAIACTAGVECSARAEGASALNVISSLIHAIIVSMSADRRRLPLSLREHVIDELGGRIARGELKADEMLRTENGLAGAFGE